MQRRLHFIERISVIPLVLAGIVLFLMMVMTFADVVLRSAFDAPIEAATELTRLFMAIIVFTVLPVASAKGEHISVDLLDPLFTGWGKRLRDAAIDLTCGAMLFWPAERVAALAERARSYGDVTEYLEIPQFYLAWFIAVATFVTAGILVIRGVAVLIWGDPTRD